MTKTFEEELKDREAETFSHWDGCTISKKEFINYADVVNLSQGWVSPEEHQARVNELIEAKEKKIKQLRKINHLYKKSKENAERLAVDRGERLNQAQDELASLESQLQQQALPVVPSFVAEWIECIKGKSKNALALLDDDDMPDDMNEWLFFQRSDGNINLILRAWLDGFTVEKPQLFYLKNKLTGMYLYKKALGGYGEDPSSSIKYLTDDFKFTQQEIDSMETESYEQIEVIE